MRGTIYSHGRYGSWITVDGTNQLVYVPWAESHWENPIDIGRRVKFELDNAGIVRQLHFVRESDE